MHTSVLMFAVAILPTALCAQSVVTQEAFPGTRNITVVFYDDRFLFMARHYGSPGEPANREPGFFVHSKMHARWLQILQISTKDAKLGKSDSVDPEERKRLEMCQARWDFTAYTNRPWIEVPLKASGAIWFPDKIEFDAARDRYKMSFATKWKVEPAVTVLSVSRKDLSEQFDKLTKP